MRHLILIISLLVPIGALASGPDQTAQASGDPYTGFISGVQEKLRELGFDAGPVNGDFGGQTQAALAQFQLSRTIPASGQLDKETLSELGLERPSGT